MNHLTSTISEKYNIQTFQNHIDCPHTTCRSISNWSWNLLTFQNFHLWVENFKNRNESIPAGNSIPELGFGFFDVKALLYIKWGKCKHVLWLYTIIWYKTSFFRKPTNDFKLKNHLINLSESLNGFHFLKVQCLSFLTHYQPCLYDF